MENIGGRRLPPGEIIRIAVGGCTDCWGVSESLCLELSLSALLRESVGRVSLIGEVGIREGSGMYDDADDRSDRRLVVRVVRMDGSELADDTVGEPFPVSGDDAYKDGD